MLAPAFFTPVAEDAGQPPRLFVIVDTEEEFDWSAPFARENTDVSAISETVRLQQVLAPYRLRPTYVVDYPVASTEASAQLLGGLAHQGECRIGAHLHPWVTPPFDEPLVPEMSFGMNLGEKVERAKIESLTEAIEANMNVRPRIFKAGRYGFGESTARILEALEYDMDGSVIPHMDFSGDRGPNYRGFSVSPATFGAGRRLLELPCTTGYVGAGRGFGEALHELASASWLQPLRAIGILARSGILNRVMLSPEGNTLEEMRALTGALHGDGLRTFAMTLHSPSLKPGCTTYVRTAGELQEFLGKIDRFCDFFFTELGGQPTTADELLPLTRSPIASIQS